MEVHTPNTFMFTQIILQTDTIRGGVHTDIMSKYEEKRKERHQYIKTLLILVCLSMPRWYVSKNETIMLQWQLDTYIK